VSTSRPESRWNGSGREGRTSPGAAPAGGPFPPAPFPAFSSEEDPMTAQPPPRHIDPLTIPLIRDEPEPPAADRGPMMEAGPLPAMGGEPNDQGLRLRVMAEHAQGILSDEERDRALADDAAALEIIIDKSNLLQAWFLEVGVQRARTVCKILAEGTNFRGE